MVRSIVFLFSFMLFGLLGVRGQLALDSSDLPDAPSQFVYSTGSLGPTVPPLSKDGQGVIWDYDDMDRIGQSIDSFFQVSNTPNAYQVNFNNPFEPQYLADHAQKAPEASSDSISLPVSIEDRYDYYKKGANAYELLGFGAKINGFPTSSKYDPKDRIFSLPLQYGVTDSSYAHLTFDAIPQFYYEQERWRVDTVDGEGTLLTPYSTYDPCIRIKTSLMIKDSLKSDSLGIDTAVHRPQRTIYEWYAQGEEVPVLRIVERGGGVNRVEYRDTLHNTSIQEDEASSLRVRPNPFTQKVFLDVGEEEWNSLEVRDLQGKKVLRRGLSGSSSKIRLDLGSLPTGIYLLRVYGDERTLHRKLVKE